MRRKGLWILFFIAAVSFLALTAVHAVARELPPGDEPFRLTIPEGQEYTKPYGPIYGFPVLRQATVRTNGLNVVTNGIPAYGRFPYVNSIFKNRLLPTFRMPDC